MSSRIRSEFPLVDPGRASARRARPRAPFRVLVIGDFTGRASRGLPGEPERWSARSLEPVDVDTLEDRLKRLGPRLTLPLGGQGAELAFDRLDDFRPEGLFRRIEVFQKLRELRARRADPKTAVRAAEGSGPPESDADTLRRLLGRDPSPAARGAAAAERLIRELVQPHIVPGADPRTEKRGAIVDQAIAEQMRAVLHDPLFQALESLWRSTHRLISGLAGDGTVSVHLLDATRADLEADVEGARGDRASARLSRLLADAASGAAGEAPWSLLVGDLAFGAAPADLELLEALGAIAARAGAPFLAAASPRLLGCESLLVGPDPSSWRAPEPELAARWRNLRRSPAARWIALSLPRVLLRHPYGRETDPVEGFPFEEMPPPPEPAAYLWGNPAFDCAALLARSFEARGREMEPGDDLELDDRPTHAWRDPEGVRLQPAAEVALSERAGEAILDHGIMPVMAYRNRNACRVLRFQSIADPAGALLGPWSAGP